MRFIFIPLKKLHALSIILTLLTVAPAFASLNAALNAALTYNQKRQPQKAIEILAPLHNMYPEDPMITKTLASSYIGLTPFTALDIIPLARLIDSNKAFEKELQSKRNQLHSFFSMVVARDNKDLQNFNTTWERINKTTDNLMFIQEYMRHVPDVNQRDYETLVIASELYQSAFFSLYKGDALMPAFVKLIIFKYRLKNNGYFPKVENAKNVNPAFYLSYGLSGLKEDMTELQGWLSRVSLSMGSNSQDFSANWEKLEDFIYEYNLELGMLFTAINL